MADHRHDLEDERSYSDSESVHYDNTSEFMIWCFVFAMIGCLAGGAFYHFALTKEVLADLKWNDGVKKINEYLKEQKKTKQDLGPQTDKPPTPTNPTPSAPPPPGDQQEELNKLAEMKTLAGLTTDQLLAEIKDFKAIKLDNGSSALGDGKAKELLEKIKGRKTNIEDLNKTKKLDRDLFSSASSEDSATDPNKKRCRCNICGCGKLTKKGRCCMYTSPLLGGTGIGLLGAHIIAKVSEVEDGTPDGESILDKVMDNNIFLIAGFALIGLWLFLHCIVIALCDYNCKKERCKVRCHKSYFLPKAVSPPPSGPKAVSPPPSGE